jgi:osmotically-inducible protein OsmY
MLKTQKTQTNLTEFSRVEDRMQLMADTHNRNRIMKKMDITITERVDDALWKDEVLRSADYQEIDIYMEDQIVYLRGYVASTMNQRRVENAIHTVPGVLGVKSSLFSDDNLVREVAGALGRIEHVYKTKFFTGVRYGVVALNGEVSDTNVRSLAEKCAASIPGVRGVLNYVHTPGVDRDEEDHRFLQPSIGEQIYFRDGPSGIVKQVIINPNNLRAVAMIVQGHFSKSPQSSRSMAGGEASSSKKVVIPMREIRYLTKRSGFLNIKSIETARYEDFDPASFISPKKDWVPPYPYYLEDVLFPAEYREAMNPTDEEAYLEPFDVPIEASLLREQGFPVSISVAEAIG